MRYAVTSAAGLVFHEPAETITLGTEITYLIFPRWRSLSHLVGSLQEQLDEWQDG